MHHARLLSSLHADIEFQTNNAIAFYDLHLQDAILAHMVNNNLLAGEQHGFVPARNCITQLILCLEDWTDIIEKGESFDVIYTDFSKAFDSVAHERLIVKMVKIIFDTQETVCNGRSATRLSNMSHIVYNFH